ncbi:MAG: DUF6206 family protein [Actinomycetota bacterium]
MTDTAIPTEAPEVSDEALREADAAIDRAIAARDTSDLHVLGFGEFSVALGWPTAAPEYVLKRALVYDSRASCQAHFDTIQGFVDMLEANGADVIASSLHVVERPDGRASGYVTQPLVPKDLLAQTALDRDEPRADHPVVLAHRDMAVHHCTPEYAVDLQVPNFAFDGDRYAYLDITSPVTWDADGTFTGPIPDELVRMVPAPIRPTFRKEYAKAASGFRTLPGALHAALVFLHRGGHGQWAPAFAEAFNELLDEPIDLDAARADYERFEKVIPMVKRTSRLQRWWQTTVRRGTYDTFITDSFSGELL